MYVDYVPIWQRLAWSCTENSVSESPGPSFDKLSGMISWVLSPRTNNVPAFGLPQPLLTAGEFFFVSIIADISGTSQRAVGDGHEVDKKLSRRPYATTDVVNEEPVTDRALRTFPFHAIMIQAR